MGLMAYDVHGRRLKIGDRVIIRGTLTELYLHDNFCNCIVELEHTMPPGDMRTHVSSLNTRQLEKENGDRSTTH